MSKVNQTNESEDFTFAWNPRKQDDWLAWQDGWYLRSCVRVRNDFWITVLCTMNGKSRRGEGKSLEEAIESAMRAARVAKDKKLRARFFESTASYFREKLGIEWRRTYG